MNPEFSMPYVTLDCHCGETFRKNASRLKEGRSYCCSMACKKALTERPNGTFKCGACDEWFNKDHFKWFKDNRYSGGYRRRPYCNDCQVGKINLYRSENQAKVREQHRKWREKALQAGGDEALAWYFKRNKGGYTSRARRAGVPFDLDIEYLVELFNSQEGRCFYSGVELEWNTFGNGKPTPTTMSLDRKDPDLGYAKGNVVLCTYLMNTSKGKRTLNEFVEMCRGVLSRLE